MKVYILFVLGCYICQSYGEFQESLSAGIAAGNPVDITKYPFVVDLIVITGHIYKLCGGTIVSVRFILTSGHCLQGAITIINVDVGSALVERGKQYATNVFKVHESYDGSSLDYDIGLVDTLSNIDFGTNIKPVVLAKGAVKPGDTIVVPGWSSRTSDKYPNTAKLGAGSQQVMDPGQCGKQYGNKVVITSHVFCAGKDTCEGDPGGPALTPDGVQVGILTADFKCSERPNVPGTYTDVASLRPWIKSIAGV